MTKEIAIKVENLSKVYKLYNAPVDRLKEAIHPFKKKYHKDFYALNDVSFEVKKGETVGVIGKNGSGKSTLLKIITGVLTPTSGKVVVNGRVSALLELGAGFNPEYTGMENIYFQGNLMGVERAEMDTRVQDILDFADIGDFIYQPVKNYSSGMFARLAFAVAINVEPDILIVDEALSVGDANFQLKCHKRMDLLRARGVSILFVSHDTYSVKSLCSKVLFLEKGVQKDFGETIQTVNNYLDSLDEELNLKNNNTITKCEKENAIDVFKPVVISRVYETSNSNEANNTVKISTLSMLEVEVEFDILSEKLEEVVFVFNFYRNKDSVYVCGATSLMDGVKPVKVQYGKNKFKIRFNKLPLLTGNYRLRVAINESKGIGVLCEENEALRIKVVDAHQSEGLIHIYREWVI